MITHAMASIGISASIQRPSCSSHITQPKPSPPRSLASLVTPNVEDHKLSENPKQLRVQTQNPKNSDEQSRPRFCDERWKNGTWDLNMFVKQGRMDWDSVIVSEAKRRKYVEMHPEASTNDEPVIFRSSIIPLWAWILHSHLPQAELLNGRAAMVGFFTAYVVDALTGLDLVGQTGNFICKTALLLAVVGVLLFQRKEDAENIRKLADEATFYDKQWQASWQNPDDVE